ncbi:arylsulfatase a family protein : Arylsulfatase A family protein OS=Singulisphaera acidiphila (strain ATCC BAA-1392 / DSM 18658 / VKM B-2454 / MOB10) GN=Sinac_5711 PE=4 SV=1: DUF1501 [Gemmata massiliana]|uniref:Sulfatase n=1 Tax=Gemmata massiliana TaxID=1210884 RepID=A0A6P2D5F5_9BACT|nr:DUF1501 domain-containing protein [Gemmata massiliana]VTR95324.1 arylsulfatase a family protein : Arylsulfatase A family protein OS=Singulisphaera acidiphila (strain ATCC BAA-1392 / DSM 18658 / VKM B-2454 / MOB10) GN=Sinac_5711 PE=4 SV=1: DUF1501 [Gemmata massiliana]
MLPLLSRRDYLARTGCGFGALALAGLATQSARADALANPLAAKPGHHPAKAKRVIFLFMQGGVSHVDSYDHKPLLDKEDGKQLKFDDARVVANTGMRGSTQRVMKPLWKFAQRGQSGKWASDLFPEVNGVIDDLCFIHSMHTEGVAHGPATLFLHCGSTSFVRPSFGSWVLYGLGSESANLPGFVSIAPSSGNGGARNYGNAFLPAIYQGTPVGRAGGPASEATIRNLASGLSTSAAQEHFDLLRELNAEQLKAKPGDAELEAVAASYELAWRMQKNAPDVMDIAKETKETQKLYGIGTKETDNFGKQCLMARRLSEAGVRFVQVTYGDNTANPAWDQHSNLPKHADHARAVDKPIAGLLADLKRRGLLEDTIVWWGGEFGRTPYAEKNGTGRDHNPGGFTMWLAGGGFKPGFSFGATDEFGATAVTDKVHLHDLHATILHQLGLNHEKLTFKFAGRNFRLTDVHGRVAKDVLA